MERRLVERLEMRPPRSSSFSRCHALRTACSFAWCISRWRSFADVVPYLRLMIAFVVWIFTSWWWADAFAGRPPEEADDADDEEEEDEDEDDAEADEDGDRGEPGPPPPPPEVESWKVVLTWPWRRFSCWRSSLARHESSFTKKNASWSELCTTKIGLAAGTLDTIAYPSGSGLRDTMMPCPNGGSEPDPKRNGPMASGSDLRLAPKSGSCSRPRRDRTLRSSRCAMKPDPMLMPEPPRSSYWRRSTFGAATAPSSQSCWR
uniref:Uncharacterized protein n=1 Tax=Anopheles atroparvus TaxID=41427 RepID=A0A182JI92_ANOAO